MANEWNVAVPDNDELVSDLPAEHRARKTDVKAVLELEHEDLGDGNSGAQHRLGSAVANEGSTTPTKTVDITAGAVALADIARDRGRLWIDDNFDPPVIKRWAGAAWEVLGRVIVDGESVVFDMFNQKHEDTDGGRECQIRAHGEQSGGEASTLGYVEISHEGAADDQKGQFLIKLNDGDDDDAPSKQPIGYSSDGKIDVANSISVLDEDNMASDSAVQVPTQQSVKAYVDADHPAYAGGESHTDGSGLIIKMGITGSIGLGGNATITFGAAFPTAVVSVVATRVEASASQSYGWSVSNVGTASFKIYSNGARAGTYYWIAMGH